MIYLLDGENIIQTCMENNNHNLLVGFDLYYHMKSKRKYEELLRKAIAICNWSLLSKKEKEICTWSLLSKKEKRKKYALGVSLFCQKIELSKKYMRQTATSRKFS
jgi:predicted Fe-S protein YdhL (DUF1289 family)